MDLEERIGKTIGLIRSFSEKCERDEYTDTGQVWDVLHSILNTWEPMLETYVVEVPEYSFD